jgi:hypothetical protein
MNIRLVDSQLHREEVKKTFKSLIMALNNLEWLPEKNRENANHVQRKIDDHAREIRDIVLMGSGV